MTTNEQWGAAFESLAHSYWTDDALQKLTQGKELLILPDKAPLLLRALGLLHRDGSMPPHERRKFFQLNHMIWLLGPPIRELIKRGQPLQIIDAGCGRSYVTLALAWCFENVYQHPVQILGIDRNQPLIAEAQRRTDLAGLGEVLKHVDADLEAVDLDEAWAAQFGADFQLSGVISLHACDTATDSAIALGVKHEADLIAVAPCCQAELARKWAGLAEADGAFSPIWRTPHLRRESAATLTDVFRAQLLKAAGYETRSVEFVASSHTPKNTLIRAIRRGPQDLEALAEYVELREATGGEGIALEAIFSADLENN